MARGGPVGRSGCCAGSRSAAAGRSTSSPTAARALVLAGGRPAVRSTGGAGRGPARRWSGRAATAAGAAPGRARAAGAVAAPRDGHARRGRPDGTVLVEVAAPTDLDVARDGMLVVGPRAGPAAAPVPAGTATAGVELEPVRRPATTAARSASRPTAGSPSPPRTASAGRRFRARGTCHRRHGRHLPAGQRRLPHPLGPAVPRRLPADRHRRRGAVPHHATTTRSRTRSGDAARARRRAGIREADATPPLPSRMLLAAAAADAQPLFRRPTGREQPWAQIPADDRVRDLRGAGARRRPAATCGSS